VELEQAVDGLWVDRTPLTTEHRAQPERLARSLVGLDVRVASACVGDDEPDQPGSDDEPDDEQPPIELGVHRVRV
jgi:hypothetical protein